jgi:hypothetical protein
MKEVTISQPVPAMHNVRLTSGENNMIFATLVISIAVDYDGEVKPDTNDEGQPAFSYHLTVGTRQPEYFMGTWFDPASIEQAQQLLLEEIAREPEYLERAEEHPAYKAMLGITARKLRGFYNDFNYHDKLMLGTRKHREPFLWVCREYGTHLFYLSTSNSRTAFECSLYSDNEYLYWNGRKYFTGTDMEEAKEFFNALPGVPNA